MCHQQLLELIDCPLLVMARERVMDPPDGTITHRRFTNLWRLEDGSWRCFARHANVVTLELAA